MVDTQDYSNYIVKKMKSSVSAFAYFVSHPYTRGDFVLKVLREMQDKRYDLSTLEKRRQCQLQALYWNPKFTPGVYLGLVCIRETLEKLEKLAHEGQPLKEMGVGPVLDNPEQLEGLREQEEYALLMRCLPEHRGLDKLLEANKTLLRANTWDGTIPSYLLLLLKRIHAIHSDDNTFPVFVPTSEATPWGSTEQLREKLLGNLSWLDDSSNRLPPAISDTCNQLMEKLPLVLDMQRYQELFERRLAERHIQRCHGDLKADNIWIETSPQSYLRPETGIRLLDCIDFKPSFYMIDTLSDMALLVADIQARTGNHRLADALIDEYVILSGEDWQTARDLLAYYLVEKAMIGMVNSYIDDQNKELGDGYHAVARQRLGELINNA